MAAKGAAGARHDHTNVDLHAQPEEHQCASAPQDAEELRRRRAMQKRRDLVDLLQPTVPRCDWKTHPRYFGSIASHFLGFHEHFRKDLRDIIATLDDDRVPLAQRVRKAKNIFGEFNSHLHVHHSIEDHNIYPEIVRKFPHLKPSMAMLDKDHTTLEKMLQEIQHEFSSNDVTDIQHKLTNLQNHLLRHLEDEEDLLVPLMLQGHLIR